MQLGRVRGRQGLRAPRREQDQSETRNGVDVRLMGWFGMERKLPEVVVQLRWLLGDGEGRGERRREEELGVWVRREKVRWLMVRVE